MAIMIELQQVVEEDDGTYTVTVDAKREDGSLIINGKSFSCKTAAELKAKIKPKFEMLIAVEKKKEQIRAFAQGVIDEILQEVVQ